MPYLSGNTPVLSCLARLLSLYRSLLPVGKVAVHVLLSTDVLTAFEQTGVVWWCGRRGRICAPLPGSVNGGVYRPVPVQRRHPYLPGTGQWGRLLKRSIQRAARGRPRGE